MNDEKDVVQEQQQSAGLMAEEAQNIESEENNAEEGILMSKMKILEERKNSQKEKSTKDRNGFLKNFGMKKMVQTLKTWLKALITWKRN